MNGMPHPFLFRIFHMGDKPKASGGIDFQTPVDVLGFRHIASYDLEDPPWVPPQGSLFRFRDPFPPGSHGSQPDRVTPAERRRGEATVTEVTGYVDQIVTVFHGTRTTIEIYLSDKKAG
jgi:hypothetical protein